MLGVLSWKANGAFVVGDFQLICAARHPRRGDRTAHRDIFADDDFDVYEVVCE